MATQKIASPLQMAVADGRLNSWKEIAAYLNRTVRTVRRWEHAEGLPVHRHNHQRQASVYSFKSELDEWLAARSNSHCNKPETLASLQAAEQRRPGNPRRPTAWLAIIVLGLGLFGLILYGMLIRHWTFVIRL